jgi:hypothetical protein
VQTEDSGGGRQQYKRAVLHDVLRTDTEHTGEESQEHSHLQSWAELFPSWLRQACHNKMNVVTRKKMVMLMAHVLVSNYPSNATPMIIQT